MGWGEKVFEKSTVDRLAGQKRYERITRLLNKVGSL
jgi:hypothetical protein